MLRLSPDPDRGASTAGETRAPGTRSRGVPVLSYVLGGVGVAALGAFGYLGLTGDSDYRALERGCGRTGACSADDVDDVRTRLRIADVALGVGVVSLAAAVVVYLVRPQANTSYARAAPALRW